MTQKVNWILQKINIRSIRDNPKNPRQISKEQAKLLENLMDEFGLIDKPILNADMMLIGGHQRVRIMRKNKAKTVECYVADRQLTDKEIDRLCIGLNKNQGTFDYDILANEYEINDLLEWGFDEKELLDLAKDESANGEVEEDGEVLEPVKDEDAITKYGDLYELDNHRLICGDSTNKDDVEKVLNGEKPILMVSDPPYGVNYDASWRTIRDGSKGRSVKSFGKVHNDNISSWKNSFIHFPGQVCYIWHSALHCKSILEDLEFINFNLIYQIIWVKQAGFSRGDYHWYHEPCFVAVKKGCKHNWQGDTKARTVWEIKSRSACGDVTDMEEYTGHSTQKPLECMARPIRNNTAEGEGVYDPFLGSGTTLIAAEKLSRKCYGIEISPAYCDVIVNRWVKLMQKEGKEFKVIRNGETIEWQIS